MSQEDKFKIYSYGCYKIQDTNKKEKIFKATKDKKDRQPTKRHEWVTEHVLFPIQTASESNKEQNPKLEHWTTH